MKYFNVVVIDKGTKRNELMKAVNKMSAISQAKAKFPSMMIVRAVETSAPLEESLSGGMARFKSAF